MIPLLMLALGCAKAPLPPPPAANAAIPLSGDVQKLDAAEEHRYLHYAVGRTIDASPAVVWGVLTDAERFAGWNSTVLSLQGPIALGETVELHVRAAPKRTFKLEVSAFEPGARMVWQDGNDSFKGVRTFTLADNGAGGTSFTMKEVITGSMMKMIAPKLPDFTADFTDFAADLEAEAERRAPPPPPPEPEPEPDSAPVPDATPTPE